MALGKDIKQTGRCMVKPKLRKRSGKGRKGHKVRHTLKVR